MRFHADHSDTVLIHRFDGDSCTIAYPTATADMPERQVQRSSFLLHARSGQLHDWPVTSFAELDGTHFERMVQLRPQIVIFGSGPSLRFPHPSLSRSLMQAHIGMETMANDAACRTFNVLAAEGRDVLLALLLAADATSQP